MVPPPPLLPVESEHRALVRLPPPHEALLRRTHRELPLMYGCSPARRRAASAVDDVPLAIAFHAPWDDVERRVAAPPRQRSRLADPRLGRRSPARPSHHRVPRTAGSAIINRATHRPLLLPMVQNALEGTWDAPGIARVLHDPAQRARVARPARAVARGESSRRRVLRFRGAAAPSRSRTIAPSCARRTRASPRTAGCSPIAVPVADDDWNLPAYAAVADRVFLMAYDEHERAGRPGRSPRRPGSRMRSPTRRRGIPRAKLVVAIGNYGYDWHDGTAATRSRSRKHGRPRANSGTMPIFDRASGNSGFAYQDGDGTP